MWVKFNSWETRLLIYRVDQLKFRVFQIFLSKKIMLKHTIKIIFFQTIQPSQRGNCITTFVILLRWDFDAYLYTMLPAFTNQGRLMQKRINSPHSVSNRRTRVRGFVSRDNAGRCSWRSEQGVRDVPPSLHPISHPRRSASLISRDDASDVRNVSVRGNEGKYAEFSQLNGNSIITGEKT